MGQFVMHTSETAKWHALLGEAEIAARYSLDRITSDYLVSMLSRFMDRPCEYEDGLQGEYPGEITFQEAMNHDGLRDFGDQCLIIVGMFPDHAERCLLPISYFVELGQSAYRQLGADSGNELFLHLSNCFVNVMDVLQNMRELDEGCRCLDPMQAHELWHRTGSRHAWEVLRESTSAIPALESSLELH